MSDTALAVMPTLEEADELFQPIPTNQLLNLIDEREEKRRLLGKVAAIAHGEDLTQKMLYCKC